MRKPQSIRKKYEKILLFVCLAITLSCQTSREHQKEGYLNEFNAFIQKVETQCDDLNYDEFVKLDKQYLKFSRYQFEKYEDILSRTDIEEIWGNRLTYLKCTAEFQIKKNSKALYRRFEDLILTSQPTRKN